MSEVSDIYARSGKICDACLCSGILQKDFLSWYIFFYFLFIFFSVVNNRWLLTVGCSIPHLTLRILLLLLFFLFYFPDFYIFFLLKK